MSLDSFHHLVDLIIINAKRVELTGDCFGAQLFAFERHLLPVRFTLFPLFAHFFQRAKFCLDHDFALVASFIPERQIQSLPRVKLVNQVHYRSQVYSVRSVIVNLAHHVAWFNAFGFRVASLPDFNDVALISDHL